MTRHFLGLYVLIIATLAAVSWGQDRLLQSYGSQDTPDDKAPALAISLLQERLRQLPPENWKSFLADAAARTGARLELIATADITGRDTLEKLKHGGVADMRADRGESWMLKQLDADHVLAFMSGEPEAKRGFLEWMLTAIFYAAIALVIMIWIWPLTRDLRALERAAAQFGNRNWRFDAQIKPHSQIHALAGTFRRMAARIDGLIASHKHMSNAVSHEIKTPLARMQFEIELAQRSGDVAEIKTALDRIKTDIGAINDLVKATLDYAILERADMALNIDAHDFTALLPAIVDHVRHDSRPEIRMSCDVRGDAARVQCDAHLLEAVIRNLLYNAARYAQHEIRITFCVLRGTNQLFVDDDGPGIPEADRNRAFESFVQLDRTRNKKTGFGLGLAIVKRAIEWHGGNVTISQSPLGGARFCAVWPVNPPASPP